MPVSAPHGTTLSAGARRAPRSAREQRRRIAGRAPAMWLPVAALTVVAAALRVACAGQSLFGDELSTYWLVSSHGLGGLVAAVRDDIEITPPLSFVLSWIATRPGVTPEALRLPALLAGTATIPAVYAVGARTVGRLAAVVAAALAALSPFLVFYSTEARAYQPMILLVLLSTLTLLIAVERGGGRWWTAYGACSCAAMYAHYTSAFVLAAQLAWVLWTHPGARRAALLANAGAAVAFAPWLPGLLADLRSPDSAIMSALSPFTPFNVRLAVEHWSVGYPHVQPTTELRDLPGVAGLALMAVGLATALAGALPRLRRHRPGAGAALVAVLALAAPAGEALVSAIGTNMLTARNLAVSWPYFALALAALLMAAGPRLRIPATALVVAGFAIGGAEMVERDFQRPDFRSAAAFVDRAAGPRDAVVDGAVAFITPGPVTGLDATLRRPHRVIRAGASERRDGNFRPGDRVATPQEVVVRATSGGRRAFVVSPQLPGARAAAAWEPLFGARGYRLARTRVFPAFIPLAVLVYAPVR